MYYIILLTHVGMRVEQWWTSFKAWRCWWCFKWTYSIIYNATTKDKNNAEIPIVQTGTKFESIGKLIIKSNGTIKTEIIKEVPETKNINGAKRLNRSNIERWVDEKTNAFISEIINGYNDELKIIVGYSDFNLIIKPEDFHRFSF